MTSSPFDRAVRDILDRVSLVQVVSEYVPLKKFGRSFKGLCPFHSEKTPSFHVSEEKRLFYCFGCQTGGNAVTFLTLAAGLSKIEAIRRLSALAGIPLPEQGPPDPAEDAAARERADLLHAMQGAQEYYREALAGPEGAAARAYLASRGIGPDVADAYGLGFGGAAWGGLQSALERRRIPLRLAEAAGVLGRSAGGDLYERFRGRLVCPVFDLDGAVVAFSARLIPPSEDGPKYVNSPETAVYRKGDALFGLHQARRAIRQHRAALLVEGNFDVLAMAAAGFPHTVAPLGTALTPAQLKLLHRFAEDVTVMFDGDEAGRKASRRAVGLLIEAGIAGRVAVLPDGEDPDSTARKRGPAAVTEALEHARPMVTYLLEALVEVHGRTPHGLRKVVDDAKEVFALERDPFRYGLYREELARLLGVDVREVRRILREPGAAAGAVEAARPCPTEEETLLELMLLYPRLIHRFLEEGDPAWVTDAEARDLLRELVNAAMTGADPTGTLVAGAEGAGPLRGRVARVLATPEKHPEESAEGSFEETMANLQAAAVRGERDRAVAALAAAQAAGDDDEAMRLLGELTGLKRRLQALERAAVRHARRAFDA